MKKLNILIVAFTIMCLNVIGQPTPPDGKHWEPVELLTDEFNQGYLDGNKWLDYHAGGWDGRDPSAFLRENVSVSDGFLKLKSTVANRNYEGDWVHSACMSSKTRAMKLGMYSESRIKCPSLSMTGAYWFQGEDVEIDVIENFGRPEASGDYYQNLKYKMLSNTHAFSGGWDNDKTTPVEAHLPDGKACDEDFFIYGVWWKDAKTVIFYLNGEEVNRVTPGEDFYNDMTMYFDMEVFTWNGLPTLESLDDDTKNTQYVDWVRTYKLEDGGGIIIPAAGVTISPETANVFGGQSTALSASLIPSNASNNLVFWSSNSSSATVSSDGVVSGVSVGTAVITATTDDGNFTATCNVAITEASQDPYPNASSPHPIPGIIEAENFDVGGEGIAYHDADVANQGGVYRTNEGVDLESKDGGTNVGWTSSGEWLEYTVDVEAGTYNIEARLGSASGGNSIAVSLDGTNLTTIDVPNTGSWNVFETVIVNDVSILGGNDKVLRVMFSTGGTNFNWIRFTKVDVIEEYALVVTNGNGDGNYAEGTVVNLTANAAPTGEEFDSWTGDISTIANTGSETTTLIMPASAIAVTATYKPIVSTCNNHVDATIEAENYDDMSGIQTESCSEGGLNVGWIDVGDWMDYCINIPSDGNYTVELRVAAVNPNGEAQIFIDGSLKSTIDVPGTGAWQTWTSIETDEFSTTAGEHTLRIKASGPAFNVNWFKVIPAEVIQTYMLTVNNGSGDGSYAQGTNVNITANTAPSGQVFKQWTGNVSTISNVNSPNTSLTMPAQNITVTATYEDNIIEETIVTLSPIHDAYLQGAIRYNNTILRVEAGNRVGYLMYDLSDIDGVITAAQLKLTCSSDAGSGNLNINLGDGTNWTESNLSSSNKPSTGTLLGNLNTTYSIGSYYSADLSASSISGGGNLSLIITQTGGNDVAFASKENSATEPQLVITYDAPKSAEESLSASIDANIMVYPNPVDGSSFTISFANQKSEEVLIAIYDIQGQLVYSTSTINEQLMIDTESLSSKGIYIINIHGTDFNHVERLINW